MRTLKRLRCRYGNINSEVSLSERRSEERCAILADLLGLISLKHSTKGSVDRSYAFQRLFGQPRTADTPDHY